MNGIKDLHIKDYKNFTATRNACKLCSPLGASLVFRGVEGCIPLIHGSQGCSTYIRRYIISHFREPVDIASSNFSESSAIFGGASNLHAAIDNIISQYHPQVIGIASTCLSETIGENISMYLNQYKNSHIGIPVIINASTPSYCGTHTTGFNEALYQLVSQLAEGGKTEHRINLISGLLSAADLRHLKEILASFSVDYVLLPDYSETLDGESWSEYKKISPGGTTLRQIRKMGFSKATVQLGKNYSYERSASAYLENSFGLPSYNLAYPIGINNTDLFIGALEDITKVRLPDYFRAERGRLIDAYIDGHKYIAGKRVIIAGDEDMVLALTSFADEIGLIPVLCLTGGGGSGYNKAVSGAVVNSRIQPVVANDSDYADGLGLARSLNADLVIGNSKGMYIARNLDIPLVRAGFPIHDHFGAQRLLHVGYRGTHDLFDRVVNTLIDQKQNKSGIGYSYM